MIWKADYEEFRTFDSDQVYRVETGYRIQPVCRHETIQPCNEFFVCGDCGVRLSQEQVWEIAERYKDGMGS